MEQNKKNAQPKKLTKEQKTEKGKREKGKGKGIIY